MPLKMSNRNKHHHHRHHHWGRFFLAHAGLAKRVLTQRQTEVYLKLHFQIKTRCSLVSWYYLNKTRLLTSNKKVRKRGKEEKTRLAAAQRENSCEMQNIWPGYGFSDNGISLQEKQILLQQTEMNGRVLHWNAFHRHRQLFPYTYDRLRAGKFKTPLVSSG